MIATWPCPSSHDPEASEYALAVPGGGSKVVLIVPPLFDEANKLRRLLAETLRLLGATGIGAVLPDLPGTNESVAPLDTQTLAGWRAAMARAAKHFSASHVLAVRGGALVSPALPGWHYAPASGAAILRQMLRARVIAAREAGRTEDREGLMAEALDHGIVLQGYPLSSVMMTELSEAVPIHPATPISQSDIGGGSLWLRAEPDFDPQQAQALAARIAADLQL